MNDYGLAPTPAQWALDAGLPAPRADEGFQTYVERVGFAAGDLLADLTPQTICLANSRLNAQLRWRMRETFDEHVDRLASEHLDDGRRREIRRVAEWLFPGQCRPRLI